MLGLKRGTVQIIDHQPEWEQLAMQTITELRAIFSSLAVDIQHVGSTAISSIKAKPILDIAVGVRSLHWLETALAALEKAGFSPSHNRFSENLLYVMETPDRVRTHQIHILPHGCEQWHNYVDFRDYMNSFPEKAREYEALKERLEAECGNVQTVYTDGKGDYMRKMLKEARAYANTAGE